MFSGSFGVRSIVLCKCSGKVLIGYAGLIIDEMSFEVGKNHIPPLQDNTSLSRNQVARQEG